MTAMRRPLRPMPLDRAPIGCRTGGVQALKIDPGCGEALCVRGQVPPLPWFRAERESNGAGQCFHGLGYVMMSDDLQNSF